MATDKHRFVGHFQAIFDPLILSKLIHKLESYWCYAIGLDNIAISLLVNRETAMLSTLVLFLRNQERLP